MLGIVNDRLELTLPVEFIGPNGKSLTVQAVIDTGYTGYISIPTSMAIELEPEWAGTSTGYLADGSPHNFDEYETRLTWQGMGVQLTIEAGTPQVLIGMRLLYGQELHALVLPGQEVALNLH
jgi:clan AA aspartic protease